MPKTKKRQTKATMIVGAFILVCFMLFSFVAIWMINQQSFDTRSDAAGAGSFAQESVFTSCNTYSGQAQRDCERAVLVSFYKSTNGPNWTNHQGWNTSTDYCNWYGIRCTSTNNVKIISLQNNGLTGRIIPELANLSELSELILNSNQLSGSIPPELVNLHKVELFELANNQLMGAIPSNIGSMNSLKTLRLNNNRLRGILPLSLSNLSNLIVIVFYNQQAGPNAICVAHSEVRSFLTRVENIRPDSDDVQPGPSVQEGLPDCSPASFTGRR